MREHNVGRFGWADEMQGGVVLAASFVLGLVTGIFLKDAGKRTFDRARGRMWHRDYERTVTYDQNLPEPLARREPEPHPAQPRFGSTGALGVSPAAVVAARTEELKE